MSGLCSCYKTPISGDSKFFTSVDVHTSRYEPKRNYVYLESRSTDATMNKVFAASVLKNMVSRLEQNHVVVAPSKPSLLPSSYSLPTFVMIIEGMYITAEKAREAVMCLFTKEEISPAARAAIEDPLKELERCLDFHTKINTDIALAQREVIEAFVDPYLPVLKSKMDPESISQAIRTAVWLINAFVDPTKCFGREIRRYQRYPTGAPPQDVINKSWSPAIQSEVIDALFMIGKVVTGTANLESALLSSGATLPSLETQKQVIMELLESATPIEAPTE